MITDNTLQVKVHWARGDFALKCEVSLPSEGVTALFGRSGCGKTSLLRVIAGLERVAEAQVSFNSQTWQQDTLFVPTERRRVGLVFQEHSLLPHMNVKDNLLYGWRRLPESERMVQLPDVLAMLEIEDLLQRRIDQLSGGQRQRVALGRALLRSPQLLLLDEPLAALDTQSKREIMPFLERLTRDAGVPIVLVTHAADEVQRLADQVVFMRAGQVDEQCTLAQAMQRVDSPLFADDGAVSVLTGTIQVSHVDDSQPGVQRFLAGETQLFLQAQPLASTNNRLTRVRIKARDVSLALDDPARISIRNHLRVAIERVDSGAGESLLITTRLPDGQHLLAEVTRWAAEQLALQPGQHVWALIKSVSLID